MSDDDGIASSLDALLNAAMWFAQNTDADVFDVFDTAERFNASLGAPAPVPILEPLAGQVTAAVERAREHWGDLEGLAAAVTALYAALVVRDMSEPA